MELPLHCQFLNNRVRGISLTSSLLRGLRSFPCRECVYKKRSANRYRVIAPGVWRGIPYNRVSPGFVNTELIDRIKNEAIKAAFKDGRCYPDKEFENGIRRGLISVFRNSVVIMTAFADISKPVLLTRYRQLVQSHITTDAPGGPK